MKNGTFEFPLDVKVIAPNAFENCKDDLEYLEVPNFITAISENAFNSCEKSRLLFKSLDYGKYGKPFMRHNGDSSLAQYVIWENSELTQNKESDNKIEKD